MSQHTLADQIANSVLGGGAPSGAPADSRDTLRDTTVIINGIQYTFSVGGSFRRVGDEPGGTTRQFYLTPVGGGDRIGFKGAGQYATGDGKWVTVDAAGNILSAKSMSQDEWDNVNNPPPPGGYEPQVIDYGNGLVAVQTPDGRWTLREVGGGGGGAPAYSSTRQAQMEAQTFQAAEEEKTRAFQLQRDTAAAEEARLDRENTARMNRLRDLNDLIQQAMGNQQRAREMKFGLRGDEFALAGTYSGTAMRGTTPTQAFGNELQQFAGAPLPQLGPNAQMPQIEQGIQQVQAMGPPPTGGGFGMAGEGALNGDEEVVTRLNDGTVLVTPLKGGAQYGATFPTTPTAESSYAALSPLYSSLGFSNIPKFTDLGAEGYAVGGGLNTLNRLGYRPNLVRDPASGQIFYRTPQNTLRRFEDMNAFNAGGFNLGDVVNLSPDEIRSIGPWEAGNEAGFITANTRLPDVAPGQGAFGPAGTPFVTPFRQVLPNPYNVAGQIRWADPIAAQNYASAYGYAQNPWGQPMGISPDQLMAMAEQPFPRGIPRSVLGYR